MNKLKLFKNKKGFLIRDVAIALVLSMAIISLFVIVAQAMAVNYNRSDLVNTAFSQHYNQLNTLTGSIEKGHTAVNSPGGTSLLGQFDVVFNSFFSVVGITWDSYNIMFGGIANIISDFTFLDPTVVQIFLTALVSALLIYLLFSVVSSVTRGRI